MRTCARVVAATRFAFGMLFPSVLRVFSFTFSEQEYEYGGSRGNWKKSACGLRQCVWHEVCRFMFLPRPQAVRLRSEQPPMDWPNSFVNVFRSCDTCVKGLEMGA